MEKPSSLRPFFSFYGGKWRDAIKHYPNPRFKKIIEPFAGSAGFSVRYAHMNVVLYEIDPVIFSVWQYLTRVRPSEILSIPDVPYDGSVDDLKIAQEAKWLVGFWLNRGTSHPRKRPSKWMRSGIRPGSSWGDRVRHTIASQVTSIRHWEIYNLSYIDSHNEPATWFVDPPYQNAGKYYSYGSDAIDFEHLGSWCRHREGQVIVCENVGADWLPFEALGSVKTTRADRRSEEAIWINEEDVQFGG